MPLVNYIKYPSLKEMLKITSEQSEVIVNKNISTLENGINILGELTDLGNVYEAIIEMKAFRFLEIPGGNKKAIKSVDEILKILKAMQVECQNTSCMILVQINKMKLTIICDDVYTNKRHGLYLYSNGSKYNILYTVGKSLRNK